MKTKVIYALFTVVLLFTACKATDKISKEERIRELDEKVGTQTYTFEATRANPMSGRNLMLTGSYTLQVTPDSIVAYLPYFGRVYSLPSPMEEGGIKFTSTDFKYTLSEKDKGVYRVAVEINDHPERYSLSMLIGESGNGTLYVSQLNKQAISFYGNIE